MVDIRFEGDYKPRSPLSQERNSRITQFFIDKSFGLINTPAQAAIAQLVVAIIFFILAGYMFSKSDDTAVPTKTSQELIDATLPKGARR